MNKARTDKHATPPIDPRETLDLVMRLMEIPGSSGQEGLVARFVHQKLLDAGADPKAIRYDRAHRRSSVPGDTGNLILRLDGTRRGARRLLTSHMDTVPICVGSRPKRNGNLVRSADSRTGLGADNRAGVAVTLNAAQRILRHKLPHPPLTFCWFVQEEIGLQGSRLVNKSLLAKPKLAFNWDGGAAGKLTIGATGGYRMRIDVQGIASHAGGAPEQGVSAIAIASLAIADLQRGGWHGDVSKGRQRGTSNVGGISGGKATNVVTDHVTIQAEARSHQPAFRERIVAEIEKAFRKAAKEVRNVQGDSGQVSFDGRLDYEAFRLKPTEPCVRIAQDAARREGIEPLLAIANGGLDANWITRHGIPTVSLGCGQLNQHMVSEMLDVDQFQQACRVALRIAMAEDEVQ